MLHCGSDAFRIKTPKVQLFISTIFQKLQLKCFHFQQPQQKSAITSEVPNVTKTAKGGHAANSGGNGHRRQELNTGIAPVALQEEMNDIQVRPRPNLTNPGPQVINFQLWC